MSITKVGKRKVLSVEELKENLHYNPETGIFTRIKANYGTVKIGDIAGTLTSMGYIAIRVGAIHYQAHRLAWLYMTGEMPTEFIDHIDCIKSNNRFCNLRESTNRQNAQNLKKAQKHNSTGFLGVSYDKKRDKFKASIYKNGKSKHLGRFDTAKEAHEAYLCAKREFHEFCTI